MNKHLIVLGIAVLLICVGLSGCVSTNYSSSESDNQNGNNIQYKSWHVVESWFGDDEKTTNRFHITGNKIKIEWEYDYDTYATFRILLYDNSGTRIETLWDSEDYIKGSEEFYVDEGYYYLKISSANTGWFVRVYEWR